MIEWIRIALEPSVIRRALVYAVLVGALLVGINHGSALLHGNFNSGRLLQMGLTVMVPYLVSTFSSVGAIREFRNSEKPFSKNNST
jgi:hypothetical protein